MEIRKPAAQQSGVGFRKKPVSKITQKRVKRNKMRGVLALGVASAAVLCLILLSRSEKLFIKNITVTGIRSEYAADLKSQSETYLQGSYLAVFPKRNIFLFPEKKLSQSLLKNNTYLESIVFMRSGLNSLDVQAKERSPYFYVEQISGENLFIDVSGIIYSDSNREVGTSTIPLRETSSDYSTSTSASLPFDIISKKGSALPMDYFNNLTRAIELFKAKNFTIYSVILRPQGDTDIQITPEGGAILINLYDDIDKTLATFSAAKKIETLRSKLSENRSALKYIDLRFGNKVFYMFSSENPVIQ